MGLPDSNLWTGTKPWVQIHGPEASHPHWEASSQASRQPVPPPLQVGASRVTGTGSHRSMEVDVAVRPLHLQGSQPQPGCALQAGLCLPPEDAVRCPCLDEPVPSHTGLGGCTETSWAVLQSGMGVGILLYSQCGPWYPNPNPWKGELFSITDRNWDSDKVTLVNNQCPSQGYSPQVRRPPACSLQNIQGSLGSHSDARPPHRPTHTAPLPIEPGLVHWGWTCNAKHAPSQRPKDLGKDSKAWVGVAHGNAS